MPRPSPIIRALALVLAGLAAAASPSAAARLEWHGAVPSRRVAESALAPALAAPRDSAALATGLGRLVAGLQDEGWLDARASGEWSPAPPAVAPAEEPVMRLVVREGARARIVALSVDAGEPADSARFASALGLTPGDWASPARARAAVERAVRAVVEDGYPYAQLGVIAFDWDASGARVRMAGTLGPRVTISRVRFEGLTTTREDVANRALGSLAGTTYSHASAEAARERLVQLGLFRSVAYEGLEGEGDWTRGQLVYRVEEPRYNRFEGAVGVQGRGDVVGLARLELDNLAGTGRAAALRWDSRGHGVEEFGARYAEPLVLGAPLRLEGALEQHVEDTLYTRTRWGGRLRFALSGQERLDAGYEQDRVVLPVGDVEEASLATTVFGLERDARDDRLSPRRGTRARLTASQTFKREDLRPEGTRKSRASAVEGVVEVHRRLRGPEGLTGLSLELSGAGRFSSQSILPLFERYPLGGAATLRGHDEQEFLVDRYVLARLEWRVFLGAGRQRVALFWDHAAMATRVPLPEGGDRLDQEQRDGVGFGLRFETAGGLIGVDYGLEPGRAPLEGKVHLQLVSLF